MEQRDLEELVNLKEDDESNNESDTVIPGPNCRGLGHWRPATKLLGFVGMAFCLALLVFRRSSILTSRMEVQKEYTAAGNQIVNGGTQTDNSINYNYGSMPGQKPQKHPEIADLPADDILCKMMHPPGGITLPVMGGSQWKKMAAPGGTYCGPLSPMHKLPETLTVGHSVGHAWLTDGAQYVGPWKHGQPDSDCQLVSGQVQCHGGKGTFYYADGTKKHGYWHGRAFCSDAAAVSRNPQCITDWGLVKTWEDAEMRITSVALNDNYLAALGYNKVRIYSTKENFKLFKTLEAEESIHSIALNDKYVAVGGNKVRIYSIEENFTLVKTLEEEIYINSVVFNDKFLAIGGLYNKVHIYLIEDRETGAKFAPPYSKTLEVSESRINSVAFNDKFLAVGGDDKKVRIYKGHAWPFFDGGPVKTLEAEESIHSVVFNDKFLAIGGRDKKVRIYSIEDWKFVKTLDVFNDKFVRAEGYSKYNEGTIYSTKDGGPLERLYAQEGEQLLNSIHSIAFNDKFLAAGGFDKKVSIYSIEENFKLVKTLDGEQYWITSVAFNDKFVAAVDFHKGVRVYSIEE